MTELTIRSRHPVLGVDISRAMLRHAVRRVGGEPDLLGFARGRAESIPVGDGSVDSVMTYRFLHHLDSPSRKRVYLEIRRVSRRYAILQFSTPRSLLFRYRAWRDHRRGLPPRVGLPHGEFVEELQTAGFREVGVSFALPGIAETYVCLLERTSTVSAEAQ